MNSLYTIVALLTGIVFVGSAGASLQQQEASAIIDNWREEFRGTDR